MRRLITAFALALALASAAEFRAGVATVNINPPLPFWLTGFAARTRPAESVTLDLHAKALAIEGMKGGRVAIITADLLGVTREISTEVAKRLGNAHGLTRAQILFNASHTHSGPSVWPRLHLAPVASQEVDAQVKAYGQRLIELLTTVAVEALQNMQPADISFAQSSVGFASNRRTQHLARLRPGEQFPAPTDHSVPVWRISGTDGKVLAVLFGYACHATVLTSEFTTIDGDYPGYAQRAIERDLPGSTALFLALCGGDQGAMPRSKRELAVRYGEALAAAVKTTIVSAGTQVRGSVAASYEEIRLPFQVHTRELYAAESKSTDVFAARRGHTMLAAIDAGNSIRDTPYPVAAMRFGDSVTLIALGGEVVVDYALRLKEYQGRSRIVVAAYSNDVMGYIPSLRVQREGGYEAGDSMMYYMQPGWFTEEVEELVLSAARRAMTGVGHR